MMQMEQNWEQININPMTAVVPQASNQATNGAANLVHTWTDSTKKQRGKYLWKRKKYGILYGDLR